MLSHSEVFPKATSVVVRRGLMSGLIFFGLVMSLGHALAGDAGTGYGSGNLSNQVNNAVPAVWFYEIKDAGGASKWGQQLDVQTTYYAWVTVNEPNGWVNITHLYVNFWYDGGSDALAYGGQTSGKNFRLNLSYTNTGPLDSPALSEWALGEGNIQYASGSSAISTNVANQNYTFKLAFQLNATVRAAPQPVNSGTSGYDDPHSWNAQFIAMDSAGDKVVHQFNQTTGVYFEFGVFRFTHVSVGGSWSAGPTPPGTTVTTGTVSVSYSSNANYTLRAYLNTTLTSGSNTILITDISIQGGQIGSYAAFNGTGSGTTNARYLYGSASAYQTMDANADSLSTSVAFQIVVPLGTPVGTYTATVTFQLDAKALP